MSKIFIILFSILILNTSCINENNAECYKEYFIDVTTSNIEHLKPENVTILVYDNSDNLVGQHYSTLDSPLDIGKYREYNKISLVAIGGSANLINKLTVPDLGTNISTHDISLTSTNEKIGNSRIVQSPDDLFLGNETVDFSSADTKTIINKRIYIDRHIASMMITVRAGVGNFSDIEKYTFIINHTKDKINYKGSLGGQDVVYKPNFTYDITKLEAKTSIFNTLHSNNEAISIDIYSGEVLIMRVTQNSGGTPFKLEKGKLLNVLIEFNDSINVSFLVSKWGNAYIFQEFN